MLATYESRKISFQALDFRAKNELLTFQDVHDRGDYLSLEAGKLRL